MASFTNLQEFGGRVPLLKEPHCDRSELVGASFFVSQLVKPADKVCSASSGSCSKSNASTQFKSMTWLIIVVLGISI